MVKPWVDTETKTMIIDHYFIYDILKCSEHRVNSHFEETFRWPIEALALFDASAKRCYTIIFAGNSYERHTYSATHNKKLRKVHKFHHMAQCIYKLEGKHPTVRTLGSCAGQPAWRFAVSTEGAAHIMLQTLRHCRNVESRKITSATRRKK